MDSEHDASFACPQCGEPMSPGEVGIAGRAGLSISWRDVHEGEPGPAGTIFLTEDPGSLVRPGLVCRPCSSIYVDFAAQAQPTAGTGRPTFDERVRDMQGGVSLEALAGVLREGEPRACAKAVQAFAEVGEPAIPVLEQLCEDEDPDVRVDARKALDLIRQTL